MGPIVAIPELAQDFLQNARESMNLASGYEKAGRALSAVVWKAEAERDLDNAAYLIRRANGLR